MLASTFESLIASSSSPLCFFMIRTTLSGSDPVEAAPNQSGSVRGFPPPEEKDADAEESDALIRCQIRVVTFDLDNTVWRTDPTIAAANDALAYYLTAECGGMISSDDGVAIPRVENVMKDLFRAHPDRYGPKKVEESGLRRSTGKDEQTATHSFSSVASSPISAPVQLTKLRKDAIREVLKSCSQQSYAASDSDATVDRAFEHWVRVRHDAIGSHLADEAHECLAAISRIRTSEGHPVLIGAITDGNSDPSLVECLEPYFDFCVNAESVGIAKPSAILYLEAASLHVLSHPSLHMIRPRSSRLSDRNATAQEEDSVPVEELIGPWWVHVGDDFIKDVVASKSLKMRSVWCRELVGKTTPRLLSSAFTPQNPPLNQSPRRTVEDLVREVSEMKVVRMEVGSDDYLAESVRREFADAVLDRFADLVPLLRSWHDEGLDHAGVAKETEAALRIESIDLPWTVDRSTDRPPPPESSLHPPGLSAPDTKFCIHCGEKLPAVAKFCSACGQKQI
jgi:FMN phosphatase YigB (HAD superfamily)